MQTLDQAVAIMRAGKGSMDGARAAAKLEALVAVCEKAARLWQSYLDKPGAAGDKFALVSWVGPDRARQLHELGLEAQALMTEINAGAGKAARFLVLDNSPVVDAYRGLKEGETGPQAAQAALAEQQDNIRHLRDLAGKVRGAKPAAPSRAPAKPAGKAAGKKPAQKKQAAGKKKPTAKKAAKKAAPKKKTAGKTARKAVKKRR